MWFGVAVLPWLPQGFLQEGCEGRVSHGRGEKVAMCRVCHLWSRAKRLSALDSCPWRPREASLSERTIQRLRTAGAQREGEKKAAFSDGALLKPGREVVSQRALTSQEQGGQYWQTVLASNRQAMTCSRASLGVCGSSETSTIMSEGISAAVAAVALR